MRAEAHPQPVEQVRGDDHHHGDPDIAAVVADSGRETGLAAAGDAGDQQPLLWVLSVFHRLAVGVGDVRLLFTVVNLYDAGVEALEGHGAQVRQFENVEVSDRQPRARFEVMDRRDGAITQPAL